MRNDVVGRLEPFDDLKSAWLLQEHPLARIVRMADLDHKPIRHPPNELALVERDRHKLAAGRIRALAQEIQPGLFNTLASPFVHLLAQGFDQRFLALKLPILMCFHDSPPPVHTSNSHPVNRPSVLLQGYAACQPATRGTGSPGQL